MEQVAAIRKLQKRGQLKDLPPKLRETAKLRLENLRRRCRSLPPCRIRLFPNPQ